LTIKFPNTEVPKNPTTYLNKNKFYVIIPRSGNETNDDEIMNEMNNIAYKLKRLGLRGINQGVLSPKQANSRAADYIVFDVMAAR
jgi:hypothetical protein